MIGNVIVDTIDAIRDRVHIDAQRKHWDRGYYAGAHDISKLVVDDLNRRVEASDPAPEDVALRDRFAVLLAHWLRAPQ